MLVLHLEITIKNYSFDSHFWIGYTLKLMNRLWIICTCFYLSSPFLKQTLLYFTMTFHPCSVTGWENSLVDRLLFYRFFSWHTWYYSYYHNCIDKRGWTSFCYANCTLDDFVLYQGIKAHTIPHFRNSVYLHLVYPY